VDYVREKVYDKKNAQTQTVLDMIDNSMPYITKRGLDEKLKMEYKIKNIERTLKEKSAHVEQVEKKLK
jgi:hypothetical protein